MLCTYHEKKAGSIVKVQTYKDCVPESVLDLEVMSKDERSLRKL